MTHKFKPINKLGKIQEKIMNSSPEIEGAKYDKMDVCFQYCCCICPPGDQEARVNAYVWGFAYTMQYAS